MSSQFIIYCLIWMVLKRGLFGASADQGDQFLQSIMTKLQEERPATDNYNLFHDQLLDSTQRSAALVNEIGIDNQDNNVQQPLQYDLNQQLVSNIHLNQLGQDWSQLFNQPAPLSVPYDLNGQSFGVRQPSQYNVHDLFANLDAATANVNHGQAFAVSDPTTDGTNTFQNLHPHAENTGPNLFTSNDLLSQLQSNYYHALPFQGVQNTAAVGAVTVAPESGQLQYNQNDQLVPTFYFLNPTVSNNHLVDDNLIDDTLNAMRPNGVEEVPFIGDHGPLTKFPVEPLFVAMAGFVGIAIIFMSCVLFLPKIFTSSPEITSFKGPQELAALTKLAVKAVEGHDCTERIACEVGRAMRSMQVEGKPIKVLEVMLPPNMAQQLALIRKAIVDKRNCHLIQCKPNKGANNKMKTILVKKESKTEEQPTIRILEHVTVKATNKPHAKEPNDKENNSVEPRLDFPKNETTKKAYHIMADLKKVLLANEGNDMKNTTVSV